MRRKLDLDRERVGPDSADFAESLNRFAYFLCRIGQLPEAEAQLRQALALTEALEEVGHSEIPHRLYNLATVLLLEDKVSEAQAQVERAWTAEPEHEDIVSALLLITRVAIALLVRANAGLYVGQLKVLLREKESGRLADDSILSLDFTDFLSNFRERLQPEAVGFLEATMAGVNDPEHLNDLEAFAIWREQPPISLTTPWPTDTAHATLAH